MAYNCSLALALDTGQARVRYINLPQHNKIYFGMRARKYLPQKILALPYPKKIKVVIKMREEDLNTDVIQNLFVKQVMELTERTRKARIAYQLSNRWS